MDREDEQSSNILIDSWERELARRTAARIRTEDREELEAELLAHLLRVKSAHRHRVKYWKAYLRTALENKAKNWIRDRQWEASLARPLEAREHGEESLSLAEMLAGAEASPESRAAFAGVWAALPSELRQFWQVLVQENGNHTRTAARLKIHRNTARMWLRRIQKILSAHGY